MADVTINDGLDSPAATGRAGRTRARWNALRRHPVRWLVSHATRRRGVVTAQSAPVSASEVLERLVGLPISTWTYGFDHDSLRHIGPMAQDFANAFGVGSTDRMINMVDANGVCMASIQALHRRLVAVETQLADLISALERGGVEIVE